MIEFVSENTLQQAAIIKSRLLRHFERNGSRTYIGCQKKDDDCKEVVLRVRLDILQSSLVIGETEGTFTCVRAVNGIYPVLYTFSKLDGQIVGFEELKTVRELRAEKVM